MRDHAGQAQPLVGAYTLVVVVAVVKIRIGDDGPAADAVERNSLGGQARGRSQAHGPPDLLEWAARYPEQIRGAHSSTCMPPRLPPITASSLSIPRCPARAEFTC